MLGYSTLDVISEPLADLPGPERNEEPKPGEEEYPAMDVDRIEERDRSRLLVYRVDIWTPPEE